MARVYEQVYTGDWLPYRRRGQVIECCDCCLVHIVNFRVRKGRLEIQVFTDKRKTAQRRNAAGIKVSQRRKPKRKRTD